MTNEPPKTRDIIQEIEIDAPIDAVWKALTDPQELTRWLCEEARVAPNLGGSFWVSWGEGQAGESIIEAWDPGRRLVMRNLPMDSNGACVEGDAVNASITPLLQEYTLESRGGRTILRLVDSGIPVTSEWDGMYDGKTRGWDMFFRGLRHYLERHPGKDRASIIDMRPISGALTDAWNKLTGPEGLVAAGSLAGVSKGSRYSVTTSMGDALNGEVLINLPPKTLSITVENMNDALLGATFEEMGGVTYLYFTLATYGMEPEPQEEIRGKWTALLGRLFPAS